MATNFITCDTYQFVNFVTGEVIEFRALVEGATQGWTLEDAIRHLAEIHGEDHAFTFTGHVEREWDDTEYSPEDFEDDEDDGYDGPAWCDDDEDDGYDGPAWCEGTGWYE